MTADLEREARLVLRRLGVGAHLERCNDGSFLLAGKRARRAVGAAVVSFMRARDWLREEGGVLVASEAGRAWLSRSQAGEVDFAAQHRVLNTRLIKDDRGRDCYVVVNAAESPIGFLRQRGLITHLQFEAGEKLRRDFTMAQLTPRMGVDYSAPVGRRSLRPETLITETALAAKQRFNRAMRAAGPGLSDVLFDVCCILRGLEESERARNWPRASGKVVLRLALDRLVEHYGMRTRRRGPIRSWVKEREPE
jgi:hypothetical protein